MLGFILADITIVISHDFSGNGIFFFLFFAFHFHCQSDFWGDFSSMFPERLENVMICRLEMLIHVGERDWLQVCSLIISR